MCQPASTDAPIISSPTTWRELIRFRAESGFADALANSGILADAPSGKWETPDAERVRRRLLSTHIRLSDNMAPDVYENFVHIPNVLAHRGWRHVRITSREWHRDRQSAINRIRAGLTG